MTISITTINDLLKVPSSKRAEVLNQIGYALHAHELAFGENAKDCPIQAIQWTDDGLAEITLADGDGAEILKLSVTEDSNEGATK